jgi:cyanophycinase-like exopeptidase
MTKRTKPKKRGQVYLVGSGQDEMLPKVAARAVDTLRKKNARVAVTYSPVAGDAEGLRFMSERMARLFPDAALERFSVTGEDSPMSPTEARAVIDRADLIFVSGGDPSLGAKILERGGASAWLREANARGVPLMGVSAGAIILGAFWADWPEEADGPADPEAELSSTRLLACIGAVPAHVFDTHNEDDDWDELRAVEKLCARQGKRARFIGIPTGGAIVFHADGSMEHLGAPPFVLA